jgi:2,3-bisphosphoglycerate-independent phosphoglycerate mutase
MLDLFAKSKKNDPDVVLDNEASKVRSKLVIMLVLDGLGISLEKEYNAVNIAKTPFLDTIWTKGRKTLLHASGSPVGLPDGEVGNSEVGHLNIGAGRVVYQSLSTINDAIMSGDFSKNDALLKALEHAKKTNGRIHLMGILSAGGVHGHISHLFELLDVCKKHDVFPCVHAFLDGRDAGLTDGYFYISKLMSKFRELGTGCLASMSGRFYAMDRDNRWERVKLTYDAMTGNGERMSKDPFSVLQEAYTGEENDQIFKPTTLVNEAGEAVAPIRDGDTVLIYNFREDRARQIIKAFVLEKFGQFERRHNPLQINFVSMMGYGEGLNMTVLFPSKMIENTLASVISSKGLKQLHISETEKYAHVTYFLNGGVEKSHEGETFINIPSKKVFDYAETPEMSTGIVTDEVIKHLSELQKNQLSLIVINFSNPDMLGHSGDLEMTVKGLEFVDACTKKIVEKTISVGGIAMVLSDHGNCDFMFDKIKNQVDTQHTENPVPFILVSSKEETIRRKDEEILKLGFGVDQNPTGMLADVTPTILDVLSIDPPSTMTGINLLDVI